MIIRAAREGDLEQVKSLLFDNRDTKDIPSYKNSRDYALQKVRVLQIHSRRVDGDQH